MSDSEKSGDNGRRSDDYTQEHPEHRVGIVVRQDMHTDSPAVYIALGVPKRKATGMCGDAEEYRTREVQRRSKGDWQAPGWRSTRLKLRPPSDRRRYRW